MNPKDISYSDEISIIVEKCQIQNFKADAQNFRGDSIQSPIHDIP
jgi:hypothetical protein